MYLEHLPSVPQDALGRFGPYGGVQRRRTVRVHRFGYPHELVGHLSQHILSLPLVQKSQGQVLDQIPQGLDGQFVHGPDVRIVRIPELAQRVVPSPRPLQRQSTDLQIIQIPNVRIDAEGQMDRSLVPSQPGRIGRVRESPGDEQRVSRLQRRLQQQSASVIPLERIQGHGVVPLPPGEHVGVPIDRRYRGGIHPPMLRSGRLHDQHVLLVGVRRGRRASARRRDVHVDRVREGHGVDAPQRRSRELGDVRPGRVEYDGALFERGVDVVERHSGLLEGIAPGVGHGRHLPPLPVVGRTPSGIEEIVLDGLGQIVEREVSPEFAFPVPRRQGPLQFVRLEHERLPPQPQRIDVPYGLEDRIESPLFPVQSEFVGPSGSLGDVRTDPFEEGGCQFRRGGR
mmetsp:Transcript_59802/g.177231  ORF Transcript_59802/g.177231 Transcript_59802/m.177231 type:complete len:398 (+) Transcript_59802:823-2016(+)